MGNMDFQTDFMLARNTWKNIDGLLTFLPAICYDLHYEWIYENAVMKRVCNRKSYRESREL